MLLANARWGIALVFACVGASCQAASERLNLPASNHQASDAVAASSRGDAGMLRSLSHPAPTAPPESTPLNSPIPTPADPPAADTSASTAVSDPAVDAADEPVPPDQAIPGNDAQADGQVDAPVATPVFPPEPPSSPGLDGATGPGRTAVTAEAYAILSRGEIERVSEVLVDLDRAGELEPPDAYAVLYAGAFRLWKGVQGTVGLGDLLALPTVADQWLVQLTRAHDLLPDDFRVTGFLCNARLIVGTLRADDELFARGMATCETAIAQMPAYGYFLRATATAILPSDDPHFTAFDDMLALMDACQYPLGDAEHRYQYPADASATPLAGICLDEGIVPHVFEGIFLMFGDVTLKATGDVTLARALYRSAQTAPNYESWPFAKDLEERIEQASDRAARFHDADVLNDPLWASKICVGCHQDGALQ